MVPSDMTFVSLWQNELNLWIWTLQTSFTQSKSSRRLWRLLGKASSRF